YRTMGKHPAAQRTFHLKSAYELLKRNLDAFGESMFEGARRFALPPDQAFQPETILDPLPYRGGPLLHTEKVEDTARGWYAVLNSAEHLASRSGALAAGLSPSERVELERQINLLMDPASDASPRERLLMRERLDLMNKLAATRPEWNEPLEFSPSVEALKRSW